MPSNVAELLSLFNLERRSDGFYDAPAPKRSLLAKTYGGQYLAQALVAAEQELDDPSRLPHAIFATFLSAGRADEPAIASVETLRDGKSFSTRRVALHQGSRPLLDGTVSFHVPETGYMHQASLPDVPPPDCCLTLGQAIDWAGHTGSDMWSTEWPMVEFRYAGGAIAPDGTLRTNVPTKQRIWMRINQPLSDDPALHRTLITYLSDVALIVSALIPHGTFVTTDNNPRASLNHGLWLHEPTRADDWLLFDQGSAWAGRARAHATARIFAIDGRLVASASQEGLLRRPTGRAA
ncbi:acyl-CoA thioesterase domain-containing protein [Pseudarthrobacter sp. NPDC080039]|uniref:acyl-CoA thioesterase n=1 Tax=unclassified Pseudarthrobacter TaxID=2647000 RepID=UPI00344E3C6D